MLVVMTGRGSGSLTPHRGAMPPPLFVHPPPSQKSSSCVQKRIECRLCRRRLPIGRNFFPPFTRFKIEPSYWLQKMRNRFSSLLIGRKSRDLKFNLSKNYPFITTDSEPESLTSITSYPPSAADTESSDSDHPSSYLVEKYIRNIPTKEKRLAVPEGNR